MDDIDKLVARVRMEGPVPLPLDGWDRASSWGWDEAADSLFADLWRNTDNPAKPPAIHIGPDDFTPTITCPVALALHIAMATERDQWEVLTAIDQADNNGREDDDEEYGTGDSKGGTVVTMTEGYDIWWPSDFDPQRKE